ncbi:MAG: hypothetical protein QXL96_01360 [Ignisphaera sp.]
MSVNKDTITQCLNRASTFLELLSTCNDCAEIFIDYNHLRYPYISLLIMLVKCDNIIENCDNHLFDIIAEATMDVNSIIYGVTNLEKDLVSFRVKCGDGWLEYGYILTKSTLSAQYVMKGYTISYTGKRFNVESLDKAYIDKLYRYIDVLVKKALTIIEQEGLI